MMIHRFSTTCSTEAVLTGISLRGKRMLVTGVSAGLGVETARALAGHGAHVVGAARDVAKAEKATAHVRDAAWAGGGAFEIVRLDLASLASIRACAAGLLAQGDAFDLVITNAGVMGTPFGRTTDGFETQFGTNHLGHFVLVNRIAPLLREGARLVSVAASGHRLSDIDLDDPNFERTPYDPLLAYERSKTATVLFAVGFDRRHCARGIRATAVHPGTVQTELGRHMDQGQALAPEARPPFCFKTVAQGAATSVWAGVVAPADAVGGRYCENCNVGDIIADEPELGPGTEGVWASALDPERAEALWARSEELVGERF